jgi:hypothetical protein
MLASDFPASTVMADALQHSTIERKYKVIGDPVVRDAINSAVAHYKIDMSLQVPLDDIEKILNVAAQHLLIDQTTGSPLETANRRSLRIGAEAYHAWVWSEERAEDLFGRYFKRLVEANLSKLALRTPEEHSHKMLARGAKLLATLFPRLARSALDHVHIVAIVKHGPGFTAVSHPNVMGTIFLSPLILQDPWQAAEVLLHEAMHQKFIDLEHTHSLLGTGYYNTPSPTIRPLWNRPGIGKADEWTIDRALTVMHVYTCLALFYDGVERRTPELSEDYGPLHGFDPAVSFRSALDRAQYLRYQMSRYTGNLGYAGQKFVKWLSDLLDQLDPLPPAPEWKAHLLLDRYMREAKQVKECLADSVSTSDNVDGFRGVSTSGILEDLIGSEIATTERILSIGGGAPLQLPTSIRNSENPNTLGDRFALARGAVFQALAQSAGRPCYYYRCAPEYVRECDELLETMVERSSQRVNAVLTVAPRNG